MVIDWMAVQWVCEGTRLKLSADEKRMVIRRLADKMRSQDDWSWSQTTASKLTAAQVAERMGVTSRTVERAQAELPIAEKRSCPVCRQDMWVLLDGTVEPHGNRIFEQCEMSGRTTLKGLAAVRPDLYGWAS